MKVARRRVLEGGEPLAGDNRFNLHHREKNLLCDLGAVEDQVSALVGPLARGLQSYQHAKMEGTTMSKTCFGRTRKECTPS